MSVDNTARIAGNIANDPELTFTRGGTPVTNFVLAINRRRSNTEGVADFVPVAVYGDQAETVANYKKKGDGVKIDGILDHQSWNAPDGSYRSKLRVVARKGGVKFLPRKASISRNYINVSGNLTKDPELAHVGNEGIPKATFTVAVDGIRDDGEDTNYLPVEAWRGLATVVADLKKKGDPVDIEARLAYSQWEKNGQVRSKIVLVAEDIQFLPTKRHLKAAATVAGNQGQGHDPEVVEGEVIDPEDFTDVPF